MSHATAAASLNAVSIFEYAATVERTLCGVCVRTAESMATIAQSVPKCLRLGWISEFANV